MRRRIERNGVQWPALLGIAGFFAGYLVITGMFSARRPLWHDELFTWYIAARPSFPDVWAVLLTGAEQLPPFFYAITRASLAIFGSSAFALRLPEILGVAVAALSVYLFARRRASSICAAAGALVLLCTPAYQYAYEARPYGLVLAFSGLALVAWQRAAEEEGRARVLALACLALTLTAAIHSHYYAALMLGPLSAGELTRSFVRRRLDLPVWLCFAFPFATLIPLLPLLRAASAYRGAFWARPKWLQTVDTYRALLYRAAPALVLPAIVVSVFRPPASTSLPKRLRPALHEHVAVVCLILLPFGGVILAKTVTGAFTLRYVLATVLGLAILAAWTLDWAVGERPRVAATAALLVGACFLTILVEDNRVLQNEADRVHGIARNLAAPGLPIVIADPHLFFQLSHYAPPPVAARLVYLSDVNIALRRTQTDTPERGLLMLKQIAPLNVIPYAAFLNSRPEFLVYSSPAAFSWVVPQLAEDGRKIELNRVSEDALLFRVTEAPSARR